MAQADQDIGNANGQTVRTDINNNFDALFTNNSGPSAPAVTSECMWFADKPNNQLKIRGKDTDTDFYVVGSLGETNLGLAPQASPTFTGNVAVAAGTLGSLPVRFSGDTDTGFFRNSADDFSVVTGGTRRAHFDSNGITIRDRKALRLRDTSNSNFIAIQAPSDVTSDITLTLPNSDGNANDVLQSDGSGNLSFAALPQAVPTGSVHLMATTTVPSGYLKCDGSAISRTTYSDLFGLIGTAHGSGDGSSTFNVPDLRGEFVRGWDDGRGVDSGRNFASSQSDQNEAHNHTATSTVTDPGHFHTTENFVVRPSYSEPRNLGVGTDGNGNNTGNTDSKTTGITVSTTIANDGGTEARPRNIAMMYVIKT